MICTPTGRPEAERPAGTVVTGRWQAVASAIQFSIEV
jgi:hypothetical protein